MTEYRVDTAEIGSIRADVWETIQDAYNSYREDIKCYLDSEYGINRNYIDCEEALKDISLGFSESEYLNEAVGIEIIFPLRTISHLEYKFFDR